MTEAPVVSAESLPLDGRRRRTADSRARIIAAMLELTHAGQISVSAEMVAERAKVGLRTVFRHFKDMDSLHREMSLAVEARFLEEAKAPLESGPWRKQLSELIARRASVFDRIAPYKRAEAAHRHRSRALQQDIERLNTALRERLRAVLPPAAVKDQVLFEGLDLLLSFEAWERLRRDQNLSPRRARDVLEAAVKAMLAGVET